MALSSPWSRLIVEQLAALGIVVHVVDFERRGTIPGYMDATAQAQIAHAKQLESHVEAVHRVATPRFILLRLLDSARSLRRIVARNNADVVLTLYGGSYAATAFLSGVRPYVVYVVGSDVLLATGFEKQIARMTLNRATRVIANGAFLARKTAELAPRASVSPLYLGVDVEAHRPAATLPSVPTFICTRGFLPVYDNDTIVRSLTHLDDELLGITVSFLSTGPLLAAAITTADELFTGELRERIIFRGGVSDAEMKPALRSASFYISASLSDGTSSSLLEAMAGGLFPILSDIPANREWITHGENGLLFPPSDSLALAACIRRAIANEPWIAPARLHNRRLVEERADATVSMAALVELLTSFRRGGAVAC